MPQPRADLVQVANCANAAANLGYAAVLTYLKPLTQASDWVVPFNPQTPEEQLVRFYNLHHRLRVAELPIPRWFKGQTKWTHPSTIVSKYYFPFYLRSRTQIVHTRDWNFVKAAIQNGIPAIYEHHHHEGKTFEPEIVYHPLFQIAVTVAEPVRESMIAHGMPSDKVIQLHNGFNQSFTVRQPDAAASWRQQLLGDPSKVAARSDPSKVAARSNRAYLAVYSGGLNAFKGVDLVLKAAKHLPHIQFAFAGGTPEQVEIYQQRSIALGLQNVTFLGYILHDRLASLLQAADLLLHPHRSGEEASFTSPLKFFDYLASGTPIVATEILPLRSFQSAGIAAGWCVPDSSTALIECITHTLDRYPRQPDGYTHSIQFAQQFSWENRIQTILSYVDPAFQPNRLAE
ncbi:glycosyltransferase [Leptolyngbya ohadii]|uniref:glycosyltransferase n=1 Tax=Leptolyngbya ohadii TaxID=1962290 RepID=UPI0019D4379E|nr:glycosyltransferase [Leptolyngbya ohadii]